MTAKGYGNKKTKVVHTNSKNDSCRKGEIKRDNVVEFETLTEALEAGYRKCRRCKWGE